MLKTVFIYVTMNLSGLRETMIFNHCVVLDFSDLADNLENRIYNKLCENEFHSSAFEVLNVIEFSVKEILVSGKKIVCKVKLKVICNNPRIGKVITLTDFEIRSDMIVYSKPGSRIQIIASKGHEDLKEYNLRITDVKTVSQNILCVAELVD